MIKWNEVTWYSKLAAVIFFLGILPILTFYIGAQYQSVKDANQVESISQPIFNQNTAPTSTASAVSTQTPPEILNNITVIKSYNSLLTYTNKNYGWSFQYPDTWKVIESSDGNSVKVETEATTTWVNSVVPPIYVINFLTIKKTDFENVGAKSSNSGEISYNLTQDNIIDGSQNWLDCNSYYSGNYSYAPKLGPTGSIIAFPYNSIEMGSPDMSANVIFTNKDYLITMETDDYGVENDQAALNKQGPSEARSDPEIQKELNVIEQSFKLANGVNSIVPGCTK